MPIFTSKVSLRSYFPFISQAQKFNNSVFLAFSRQLGITRKLVCSFTFKFPAIASKYFLRYRGGILLQCPVTSGRRKNSKTFRKLPGIQYIFPLHHVNKPGNFQRGNYKSSSFEIDLFSVRSNTAAKLPLIRPYFSSRCAVFFVAILNSYE